ncbi:hypothetical protein [Jiangella alba]|uniref:Phage tail tube protein n=1 Tax=Jiangella alba TaxID=561176 RepID=A0A1H5PJA9_9ACTN|nr:hypothetical protein [Jiangella alba]SEF13796.1 hypothetical protein SAMN04488561_4477 [Jiangella alba]
MAEVLVDPIFMKHSVLEVEADNYASACDSISITPSQSVVEWRGLRQGAVFTDVTDPTYSVVINYAQDWASPESLSRYLWENRGQTKTMTFTPTDGVTPSWMVDVVIATGAIGGALGAAATASVTLPVKGEPELVELGS